MSDSITDDLFLNPDQIWSGLDSFWRERLVTTDANLVRYTTYAAIAAYTSLVRSASLAVSQGQALATPISTVRVPWHPLVIFKDQYVLSNYRTYGSGDVYAVGVTTYGQTGTSKWRVGIDPAVISIGSIVDSVTESLTVVDRSLFSFADNTLTTTIDLFALVSEKTDVTSGRPYIVVWLKDAEIDYGVVQAGLGWLVNHQEASGTRYDASLKYLYECVTLGATVGRIEALLNAAAGLPVVTAAEPVRRILDDGWLKHIVTDTTSYQFPRTLSSSVAVGTTLTPYSGVSSAIRVVSGGDVAALGSSSLPGIVQQVALSTGQVARLGFKNGATVWTYDSLRPSPWRFPVSGEPADVEQYWVDCWARQQASGVLLSAVYSLSYPGSYAVNPMQVALTDVADNNVVAIIIDFANCPASPVEALERIGSLLPRWPLLIVQMAAAPMNDALDIATPSVNPKVGYGTSLTDVYAFGNLVDYQPLVTVS